MATSYHKNKDEQVADYWAAYKEACREENDGFPVLYDPTRRVFFPGRRSRRDNDIYRKGLVERYASQIEEEGIYTYRFVNQAGWKSYRNGIRTPYKKFPRPNGVLAIVIDGGNRELPCDKGKLRALLNKWVETAPSGKSIHGSDGFGGKYAGSKPPPKGNIKVYSRMYKIKAMLRRDMVPHSEIGEEVRVNMDVEQALNYVKKKLVGG